jgi:hypothetical protein
MARSLPGLRMADLGIGCKGQSLSEDQSGRLEDPTAKRAKVIPVTSGEVESLPGQEYLRADVLSL